MLAVLREKKLFGVVITGHSADGAQEPDIAPCQVELIIQKTAAGTGRKKMMIVMPFAGDVSGPNLIDRKVLSIEIDACSMLIPSFAMSFIIEGADTDGPEAGRTE